MTTHSHVFKGSRRSIVVTVDEWPDLVYFRMTTDLAGDFHDAHEFSGFLADIFDTLAKDPRPQRLFDGVSKKSAE